jgi:RNA polymerase sigma factor (sigma-70 family)
VEDHALLEAARGGDRAALEAFIERHQPRVLLFGMKMCRDTEDARDVAQETLLAAARSITRFREASSPSTWLFTIARSFCIKKRRRSKFAPAAVLPLDGEGLTAAIDVPDPRHGPERELDDRRLAAALEPISSRGVRAACPRCGRCRGSGAVAVDQRGDQAPVDVARDRRVEGLGREAGHRLLALPQGPDVVPVGILLPAAVAVGHVGGVVVLERVRHRSSHGTILQ